MPKTIVINAFSQEGSLVAVGRCLGRFMKKLLSSKIDDRQTNDLAHSGRWPFPANRTWRPAARQTGINRKG
jgi:hypothetical protein